MCTGDGVASWFFSLLLLMSCQLTRNVRNWVTTTEASVLSVFFPLGKSTFYSVYCAEKRVRSVKLSMSGDDNVAIIFFQLLGCSKKNIWMGFERNVLVSLVLVWHSKQMHTSNVPAKVVISCHLNAKPEEPLIQGKSFTWGHKSLDAQPLSTTALNKNRGCYSQPGHLLNVKIKT